MNWLRKLRAAVWTSANGVWSGIPLCCVSTFTALEWRGVIYIGDDLEAERGYSNDVQYVQCARCHAGQNNKTIRENGTILRWLYRNGP